MTKPSYHATIPIMFPGVLRPNPGVQMTQRASNLTSLQGQGQVVLEKRTKCIQMLIKIQECGTAVST